MKKVLLLCLLFVFVIPFNVFAEQNNEDYGYQISQFDSFYIEIVDSDLEFFGSFNDINFFFKGQIYEINNNILYENFYYVLSQGEEYNMNEPMFVHLEFEVAAKTEHLQVRNYLLEGENIVRLTMFYDGTYYLIEEEYNLDVNILNMVTSLEYGQDTEIIEEICENAGWYMLIEDKNFIRHDIVDDGISLVNSSVQYHELLRNQDISAIELIGIENFTQVGTEYGYITNASAIVGAYYTYSVNYPSGSDNIQTYLVYVNITTNTPTSVSELSSIQLDYVICQGYTYDADINTLGFALADPPYRIYDVNVALNTAQIIMNTYDYIYRVDMYLNTSHMDKSDTIASLLNCVIPYNVVDFSYNLFNLFTQDKEVSKFSTYTWPHDFNEHYNNFSNGKKSGTMIKGYEHKTDGHLLQEEGDYLNLSVLVKDCDDPSQPNVNYNRVRAMIYGFQFELRERRNLLGWTSNGNLLVSFSEDMYKTYSK